MKIQERTGAGNHRSAASAQPAMGERLPTPPRERKPALAALAVLLILVGALGATMLVLRAGDRVEVVQVTSDIQAGESVGSHVTSVMVADDTSVNYVRWDQLTTLKTLKARSTIYKGTVVIGEMFASKSNLPAGKASVGLALKEGQYPADIKAGDIVSAYRVGDDTSSSRSSSSSSGTSSSSSNSLIVENARVNTKSDTSDATVSTGNLSITLLVDQSDVPALTAAAAAGDVSVVLVPGN
ncbi:MULTISPECIES: hypothetical protein [Streptomyces]|uniref:SAF domain-containing protein n=1 Tax=Streptomyces lutosisoli TaxID=2665721 RepID=A0ABW2VCD8_9ACTN|nr:hypothetical protein [Streptomyces sp. NBC_00589]WTI37087.1 hypothetical protein OIC96_19760 [Streptomyces sp. NBC_00775]WUB29237.1 hypothetical protein OHA51_29975 [Streptomyces sp. NBC_00589]